MGAVVFDTEKYLGRIGLQGPLKPDLDTLERLTRGHLQTVPFENLMVYDAHEEPSLEPADLYDKIVNQNRGGYCFELNKSFYLLLQSLGYECYPVPVRIIHRRPEPVGVSHRGTIVKLAGSRYFCDVGFGGAGPKGVLALETEEVQVVGGERFLVRFCEDNHMIINLEEGFEDPVLRVYEYPFLEPDFLTLNRYYSTYHGSPFVNKRVLYISTPQGWVSLTDKVLTEKKNGVKTVQTLESEEQVAAVIAERFGLSIPVCVL